MDSQNKFSAQSICDPTSGIVDGSGYEMLRPGLCSVSKSIPTSGMELRTTSVVLGAPSTRLEDFILANESQVGSTLYTITHPPGTLKGRVGRTLY